MSNGSWQADIDNSGTIDYGEFLAATLHLNKMEREENLVAAFSYFDKDGSGYITTDEIQQACKEFGLGDVHLEDIIKEIDQDNVSICFCMRLEKVLFYFVCSSSIKISSFSFTRGVLLAILICFLQRGIWWRAIVCLSIMLNQN